MSSQRAGQLGIVKVENIVLEDWRSRWQQVDSQNDDGIDGLIFIERGNCPTGQIIFAQVKRQAAQLVDGRYAVQISRETLERNLDRWRRLAGGAILIHVEPDTGIARWVNVREPSAIGRTRVYVPKDNIFDAAAKKIIARLAGNLHFDLMLPQISTTREDFPHIRAKEHFQVSSRALYKDLNCRKLSLGDNGPRIHFTRSGWRHITRPGRTAAMRFQSFVLLGAIEKILTNIDSTTVRSFNPRSYTSNDLRAVSAVVSFPFRQTATVKVVLRSKVNRPEDLWFYTIYEPRRKRDPLGVKNERENHSSNKP
ncbi:DUF4365 domain-containing protein [Acetobacter senegalensis]|uniref:DUF4365 domain-containing protein n=1 Tax=Acetobacter senegalensis TaxID=446692 RepID=UPI001EDB666B|nr:DUF4365 domain-containing protein [Acetobacter senegalensis]MCG4262483.1 DUF4365 domain-containing protein [Acetobacter senegalensis]